MAPACLPHAALSSRLHAPACAAMRQRKATCAMRCMQHSTPYCPLPCSYIKACLGGPTPAEYEAVVAERDALRAELEDARREAADLAAKVSLHIESFYGRGFCDDGGMLSSRRSAWRRAVKPDPPPLAPLLQLQAQEAGGH